MLDGVELLNKGMECLIENLGLVETERFISLLCVERFDYTKWREETLFKKTTVDE